MQVTRLEASGLRRFERVALAPEPGLNLITGELRPNPNELWGPPSHVAGIKIVVEDAIYVSTRNNADGTDGTRGYIKAADSALLLARPGGLDAPYGGRSFSTVSLFYYRYEMSVESRYDTWNKRHEGRVIDYYIPKVTAAPAGYRITDTLT